MNKRHSLTASEIADLSKSLEAQSMARTKRLEIKAAARNAELTIYGEIGEWGVTAKEVADALKELGNVKAIDLYLNSPGGDVFDGIAIYNKLQQHKAQVTVHIDGMALSAASIVAMAGDRILMAENGMMMIHDPWGIALGNADDMRRMAELLDKSAGTLADTYAARTGKDVDDIRALMADETWMTAAEALEAGFIDEIVELKKKVENVGTDILATYKKTPDCLKPANNTEWQTAMQEWARKSKGWYSLDKIADVV